MTKSDSIEIQTLDQMVRERTGDACGLLLRLMLPTGVADTGQMKDELQIGHDKLRSLQEQIQGMAKGLPPIFVDTEFSTKRAGQRGKPCSIYKLGPSGAELLRLTGEKSARPCQLSTQHELQHAVFMLDIRRVALKATLEVRTDQRLPYGGKNHIRPDNVVTLPDQSQALFEVEQIAEPEWIRRITESLENKRNFFQSSEGKQMSPVIRMVVNATKHQGIAQTLQVWQRGMRFVAGGETLPFRLMMMPLSEFLDSPDWGNEPDPARWIEIKASDTPPAEIAPRSMGRGKTARPDDFFTRTAREDYHVLMATLLDWEATHQGPTTHPDPMFFRIMRLIYSASHAPGRSVFEEAEVPHASLHLLREYLYLHPALIDMLNHAINKSGGMRWMPTTMAQRAQTVVNRFLEYHGWISEGPLEVSAELTDNFKFPNRKFEVLVRIKKRQILWSPMDEFYPSCQDTELAEQALSWVLRALFEYPHHLDIKETAFW